MGHERIGTLPKSKRWRAIVSEVALADASPASASEIASHRRFSVSAAQLTDFDQGSLYALNFLLEGVKDPEGRTALIDYVRLGLTFAHKSSDAFYDTYLGDIAEIVGPHDDLDDIVQKVSHLVMRFGEQTVRALQQFHQRADVTQPTVKDSLLDIIDKREYLKSEPERFAEKLCERLQAAIPTMFARQRPANENDFNDKVHGLINLTVLG